MKLSALQILLDPGIQSKLISFAGLLVANDVFFMHDIIAYVIQSIIKVQMTHPHGQLLIILQWFCRFASFRIFQSGPKVVIHISVGPAMYMYVHNNDCVAFLSITWVS